MKSLLIVTVFGLLSQAASASQILECVIGNQTSPQGSAHIEVLDVAQDPSLKVLKIDLISKLERSAATNGKSVHLQGAIVANVTDAGDVLATGVLFNAQENSGADRVIINPPTISLQSLGRNGFAGMSLIDSNKDLQHGFGVLVDCK